MIKLPEHIGKKYIGITGIASKRDYAMVSGISHECPPGYRLMLGVLVSSKTLYGPGTESLRYPNIDDLVGIVATHFGSHARDRGHALFLHYNYNEGFTGKAIADEILGMLRIPVVRDSIDGIQLNLPFAQLLDLSRINEFRRLQYEVVAQIKVNSRSADEVMAEAAMLSGMSVDHILIDFSCGTGRCIDGTVAADIMGRWDRSFDPMLGPTLGLAGGIGPWGDSAIALSSINHLAPFNGFSVDAESNLRSPAPEEMRRGTKHQDILDFDLVSEYVRAMGAILHER